MITSTPSEAHPDADPRPPRQPLPRHQPRARPRPACVHTSAADGGDGRVAQRRDERPEVRAPAPAPASSASHSAARAAAAPIAAGEQERREHRRPPRPCARTRSPARRRARGDQRRRGRRAENADREQRVVAPVLSQRTRRGCSSCGLVLGLLVRLKSLRSLSPSAIEAVVLLLCGLPDISRKKSSSSSLRCWRRTPLALEDLVELAAVEEDAAALAAGVDADAAALDRHELAAAARARSFGGHAPRVPPGLMRAADDFGKTGSRRSPTLRRRTRRPRDARPGRAHGRSTSDRMARPSRVPGRVIVAPASSVGGGVLYVNGERRTSPVRAHRRRDGRRPGRDRRRRQRGDAGRFGGARRRARPHARGAAAPAARATATRACSSSVGTRAAGEQLRAAGRDRRRDDRAPADDRAAASSAVRGRAQQLAAFAKAAPPADLVAHRRRHRTGGARRAQSARATPRRPGPPRRRALRGRRAPRSWSGPAASAGRIAWRRSWRPCTDDRGDDGRRRPGSARR